jgi:signal peptide peptidase-like protein 2B
MPDTAQGDSFLSVVLDGRMLDQSVRVSPPTAVCPCSWGTVHFARMETAVPVDACARGGADYAGSLVLVDRGGGCDFATKALHVQGAGAGAMVLRDNSTGVPVIIELGPTRDMVTIPVVSVNLEAGNMLQSYAQEDSGQHYSFELHTEDCPLSINLYVSQAALWAVGVFACIAGAYLSADHERYIATTLLPYSYRILDDDGASSVDSDRDDSESSSISLLQAVAFTAFASAFLVVLYFFIGELIIVIIVVYCLAAARSIHRLLCLLCASKLCPTLYRRVCALPVLGDTPPLAVLAFFPAAAVCCTWFFYRHASWAWALLDLMSLSLCIEIPTLISVDNMKVMTALLCMMFVYDNFWVFLSAYIFKTSVMIAVATGGGGGESLPMLFMLPHACGYSVLGIGDVAIPGLLLALTFRLDYARGVSPCSCASYFAYVCAGYAVGLAMADAALLITGAGQPALLYLVPCTLGTVLVMAWRRGELGWMWRRPFD